MLKNGEVFLPLSLRSWIGIKLGDTLDVYVKHGEIVLSRKRKLESDPSDNISGAIGFVRKSERKSGLTKKKKTP